MDNKLLQSNIKRFFLSHFGYKIPNTMLWDMLDESISNGRIDNTLLKNQMIKLSESIEPMSEEEKSYIDDMISFTEAGEEY